MISFFPLQGPTLTTTVKSGGFSPTFSTTAPSVWNSVDHFGQRGAFRLKSSLRTFNLRSIINPILNWFNLSQNIEDFCKKEVFYDYVLIMKLFNETNSLYNHNVEETFFPFIFLNSLFNTVSLKF
jgi:hypothetical protein